MALLASDSAVAASAVAKDPAAVPFPRGILPAGAPSLQTACSRTSP